MYVYVITYILIYYTVASSVNSLCEAYGWFALHLYIPLLFCTQTISGVVYDCERNIIQPVSRVVSS